MTARCGTSWSRSASSPLTPTSAWPVGVGKTVLAHALGWIACRHGYTVLAVTADKMLTRLKHARLDHTHEQELRKLLAVDVLGLTRIPPGCLTSLPPRGPSCVTGQCDGEPWLGCLQQRLHGPGGSKRVFWPPVRWCGAAASSTARVPGRSRWMASSRRSSPSPGSGSVTRADMASGRHPEPRPARGRPPGSASASPGRPRPSRRLVAGLLPSGPRPVVHCISCLPSQRSLSSAERDAEGAVRQGRIFPAMPSAPIRREAVKSPES